MTEGSVPRSDENYQRDTESMILWRIILRSYYGKGASGLMDADGGGIRGMSELIILDEIMHRVQRKAKLSTAPLPADYFDMICGTSTGG